MNTEEVKNFPRGSFFVARQSLYRGMQRGGHGLPEVSMLWSPETVTGSRALRTKSKKSRGQVTDCAIATVDLMEEMGLHLQGT